MIAAAIGAGSDKRYSLAVSWWPNYARWCGIIVIKEKLYVESAKAIGIHPLRIIFTIIIPQTMSMVIPQITMGIGNALIAASGFSFIGLGAQMPTRRNGGDDIQGSRFISSMRHVCYHSGIFIFLAVLDSACGGRCRQRNKFVNVRAYGYLSRKLEASVMKV